MFEPFDITSPMKVDQCVTYTQRILRGDALKTYKAVIMGFKHSAKDLAGGYLRGYLQKTSGLGIRVTVLPTTGVPN